MHPGQIYRSAVSSPSNSCGVKQKARHLGTRRKCQPETFLTERRDSQELKMVISPKRRENGRVSTTGWRWLGRSLFNSRPPCRSRHEGWHDPQGLNAGFYLSPQNTEAHMVIRWHSIPWTLRLLTRAIVLIQFPIALPYR